MATNSEQASFKAEPAANGLTSLADSFGMAQTLKDAITSFASGDGFNMLSHLIDTIPQLKKEIRERDDQINKLTEQLTAEKENHSAFNQKQLENYSCAYTKWKEAEGSLEKTVGGLRKELLEKDTEITTLKSEREELKAKGRDLAIKFGAKNTKLKEKEQEITQLRQQLQEAQANANSYSEKFSKSESRASKLEISIEKNGIEHQKLKEEFDVTKARLMEVLKFAASLKDVNMEEMTNKVEKLWDSATLLVGKHFRKDLPDAMLHGKWSRLRENTIFKHNIPLPQSNSDIAKDMRVVIVLGIFARLVNRYIFQPTYLLKEDSGFRELLYRQAYDDVRKERFVRGTILSMFPEEQESYGKNMIEWVVEALFEDAGVDALLPPDAHESVAKELGTFLTQVQECWRTVLYSKQKLEPNFQYSNHADLDWHTFEVHAANGKEGRKSRSPVSLDGLEDEAYVIFPRFYLMGKEPKPITHGTVLPKDQLRAAAQELRRTLSNTLFEQTSLARQRSRPGRAMSIGGDDARGGHTERRSSFKSPFL